MTIAEFIEWLQEFPQDLEVATVDRGHVFPFYRPEEEVTYGKKENGDIVTGWWAYNNTNNLRFDRVTAEEADVLILE